MLVGGRAMCRDSGDWDIWISPDEPNRWTRDILGEDSKKWDVCIMPVEVMSKFDKYSKATNCSSMNDLLTIKMSHMSWDIFWWKHAQDVLYLQSRGAKINIPLYEALKQHWKEEHGTKTELSLYRTKSEFFNDHVVKYYEHDYLHELIAGKSVPVYSKCLVEGQEVLVCRNKFDALLFPEKIRMFKEEISVIALERWLIPNLKRGSRIPVSEAWNKALHKTVVDLTKGWASEFIIHNLAEFVKPLHEDILRVLGEINLKEKYMAKMMDMEDLKDIMVQNMTMEDVSCRWFKKSHDLSDYDSESEYFRAYLEEEGDAELLVESSFVIEQEGGGEGGAEDCHSVLKIGDKFFKVTYNYYSHYGYNFEHLEVSEVWPKEKLVTVYE